MTDPTTLAIYDNAAASFAKEWHEQPTPTDLQDLVRRFFKPGLTADIGCGSGREVGWLTANGWSAIGYDASAGLLAEARMLYPKCQFETATLPELEGIADGSFDNVLCETVIMHLPADEVAASIKRLLAIVKPGGVLYLSWRVTEGADLRDAQGRLYAAFGADVIRAVLEDAQTLLDEETISASSGKKIHRLIMHKAT